jgi:hypothetical protein
MGDIFISYSRADKTFVDNMVQGLERSGFSVWMDRDDIRGGTQWRAAIAQAIRGCDVFLVVLTSNSTDSNNVNQEMALASDHKRPILPILAEACDIPDGFDYQLAGLQRIDFCHDPADRAFGQLVDAINGIVKPGKTPARKTRSDDVRQPPPPPPPPPPTSFVQVLPGRWNLEIHNPMMGAGVVTIDIAPNGVFQGQMMTPYGITAISGQWQATPMNQLVLQGQQTNGVQVMPYATMLQLNVVGPGQMTGVTMAGEQVVMARVG